MIKKNDKVEKVSDVKKPDLKKSTVVKKKKYNRTFQSHSIHDPE